MGAAAPPKPRGRLALRVGAGFGVVLLLFVIALLVTRKAFSDVSAAEAEVARLDRAKHAGHAVAALVREQYIRQAHTIITRDASRSAAYEAATRAVEEATHHLVEAVPSAEDQVKARRVALAAKEVDRVFRAQVLPRLAASAQGDLQPATEQAVERAVYEVVEQVQALNRDLEARAQRALERAAQVRRRAELFTTACFGLAMLAAALLGWALTRAIARPIEVLRSGAIRIAGGDLRHRISWDSDDELGQLATTFNKMTEELARHQEERLRAQRLNLLGQVTAGVAHELNNPIGVILGYLKLMKRDGAVTPDRLEIVEDEARQAQRIVQDLLEVVRPAELVPEAVDAAQVAKDVLGRLEESGAARGVELIAPAVPGPTAWVDGPRLQQVLRNVLSNALDASPDGAKVEVTATQKGEVVEIRVRDGGPGVDPALADRIFEPFYTTKESGTGLGLALSRSLVEAHGGALYVDLADAGPGAAFVIQLPAQAPDSEP